MWQWPPPEAGATVLIGEGDSASRRACWAGSLGGMSNEIPMGEPGPPGEVDVLVEAVDRLRAVQAEVVVVRRKLAASIVAERKAGVPVAELAARTGWSKTEIGNLLQAAGL